MQTTSIYNDALKWDSHCGAEFQPDTPLDALLAPWREAGVDCLSINVNYDVRPWTRAIENIASIRRRLPQEAPWCRLVSSVAEVDQARKSGGMAVIFDIEGMTALNGQIEMVQFYYDLGVRNMLFAYNRNNAAGSGCHDEDTGLTAFGREVIAEMNRVGMVIDCSHTGFRTTMAAMELSADPVVFSHSNPRSLVDHGRNISDEQIRACAETGGVIGINGINLFLGEAEPSPAGVARHAAYVAELTGPEHVAIALDFAPDTGAGDDGAIASMVSQSSEFWPPEAGYDRAISCLDIRRLPEVADALSEAGFNAPEIAGILGENCRRIAERVWR